MKTILTVLGLLFFTASSRSQSVAHDYLYIELNPDNSTLLVDVDSIERRTLDLRELNGKSREKDRRVALDLVEEYERSGWELYDFESFTFGSSISHFLWIMRKPKQ